MPSNQAFALNATRLMVQQDGMCVSAAPCDAPSDGAKDTVSAKAPLVEDESRDSVDSGGFVGLCVVADVCGATGKNQEWAWLPGTQKLQLLAPIDIAANAVDTVCLDAGTAPPSLEHARVNRHSDDQPHMRSDSRSDRRSYRREDVGSDKERASWQLADPSDPTSCVGLSAVDGTTEFKAARLVNCSDPAARWSYGSSYLNMTCVFF
jgi:hypothetical protein